LAAKRTMNHYFFKFKIFSKIFWLINFLNLKIPLKNSLILIYRMFLHFKNMIHWFLLVAASNFASFRGHSLMTSFKKWDFWNPLPPCHKILIQKNFVNLKCHKISDPPPYLIKISKNILLWFTTVIFNSKLFVFGVTSFTNGPVLSELWQFFNTISENLQKNLLLEPRTAFFMNEYICK